MRIGKIEITPISGHDGDTLVSVELIEVNEDLDEKYVIDAVSGDERDTMIVDVAGMRDVLEATDSPITDMSGQEMWVLKQ